MLFLVSCSAENGLASSGGGNEILFNVEEVPFKPDSTSGAATRATKLTSVSSFKLYAYNSGGTAIANGVTYTKSGSSWNPDSKVFWPQTGNVTFYAFSLASNSSVTFNTTSKTLTYTAPTAQGSQQDVLYAYKTSSRPTNNTVDLTFNHANAAFSVNARLASGCTATVNVSGVSLVNVKPTNTLTFSSGSASASGSNISSTLACSAKTLTTSNQAISSSPLIIPPQSVTAWSGTGSLANTYLAVTCKVSENDNYVVGSSSATGTVYVPMDKTLNKGEDNCVNLIFGSVDASNSNKRYYGRDANGNRISYIKRSVTWRCDEEEWDHGAISEPVDLGLSVNWAAWNIGAYKETDFGEYFSYAATAPSSSYYFMCTPYWVGYGKTPSDGYLPHQDSCWTKYNAGENKTLEAMDDAATVNWGGKWRVPTRAEMQELVDNCTWTWTSMEFTSFGGADVNVSSVSKIYGYKVTSKKSGYTNKSIFLPAAGGYYSKESNLRSTTEWDNISSGGWCCQGTAYGGQYNDHTKTYYYYYRTPAGRYWVSDAIAPISVTGNESYFESSSSDYCVYRLLFDESTIQVNPLFGQIAGAGRIDYRENGFTIRPVCPK